MKRDKKNLTLKTQLERLNEFIIRAGKNVLKRGSYIRQPSRDFTRHRKLDFPTTVLFILGLLKKV